MMMYRDGGHEVERSGEEYEEAPVPLNAPKSMTKSSGPTLAHRCLPQPIRELSDKAILQEVTNQSGNHSGGYAYAMGVPVRVSLEVAQRDNGSRSKRALRM